MVIRFVTAGEFRHAATIMDEAEIKITYVYLFLEYHGNHKKLLRVDLVLVDAV